MNASIQVKICGITNSEDAETAVQAGADLLGFILYPKSPRYVEPAQVRAIIEALRLKMKDWVERPAMEIDPPTHINPHSSLVTRHSSFVTRFVGVFVNESIANIREIMTFAGLDLAQLHGDETPAEVAELGGRGYKALRPADGDEAARAAAAYAELGPAAGPGWLIDAYDPAAYGGTGKRADWPTAARLARRHPGLLLAGGLTPDNVTAAIQAVRPWGVDVASGVEAAPGRKDHARVRAFVQRAKETLM